MEQIIKEMHEIMNSNIDQTTTQREWLDLNKSLVYDTYDELKFEDQEDDGECDNCSRATDLKWCSVDCFCSTYL
jgi:hypothetical protein